MRSILNSTINLLAYCIIYIQRKVGRKEKEKEVVGRKKKGKKRKGKENSKAIFRLIELISDDFQISTFK